ncbi:MAG: NUDIX domain-containing protein [Parcubacteria group bacterium]|jgi:8-oxo-dGTP diphosphatase
MGKQFGVAVKGIIRRGDGKILIVKRSEADDHKAGVWETVGGGMDENVAPQEELRREIREEVGLETTVGEPFNVFSFAKDNGEFKIGITFVCDYVSGEVRLSHEHTEFQWIDPADFKNFDSVSSLHAEIARYAEKFSK